MSPLSADRVFIALAPAGVAVARRRRWRAGRADEQRIACEPGPEAQPWRGALAALRAMPLAPCRVTLQLANRLVRYALVPWSPALATAAEEEGYVRHHFARIYGERAKGWSVRASEGAGAAPRLASAVDRALIDEIVAVLKAKPGVRLASLQPELMRRFNAWRHAVPRSGAWVVLAEPDRACIALHGPAGWVSVHNAKGAWRTLLERERYRVDGEVPALVLLAGASAPSGAGEGAWTFRRMVQ